MPMKDTLISEHTGSLALQHAVDAVIWAVPIVAVEAMRGAFLRDARASYNDVVYWSRLADWRLQIPTPNAATHYAYVQIHLGQGPVVLDLPPSVGASWFGSILDAWQVPLVDVGPRGEDQGNGGSYVLLPPGYEGDVPPDAIVVRFGTINGYALLRVIPEDGSPDAALRALELVENMRVYRLADAEHPPPQQFIDMSGKLFDGLVRYDESFFEGLTRILQEEPFAPHDAPMVEHLRRLGVERGKPYAPEPTLRILLNHAARTAHASITRALGTDGFQYWANRRWRTLSPLGPRTGYTFVNGNGVLDVSARAMTYFLQCAPPAKPGEASAYLVSYIERGGQMLTGEHTYRLHVPSHVPARQFWAATVYDRETAAFFRDAPRVEVNSYAADLDMNPDGSVDLYFGPKPPEGKEANWAYTAPGQAWFALFRFFAPTEPLLAKTWQLTDFQRLDT